MEGRIVPITITFAAIIKQEAIVRADLATLESTNNDPSFRGIFLLRITYPTKTLTMEATKMPNFACVW